MNPDEHGFPWQRVLAGVARAVRLGFVSREAERPQTQVVFPGAFNPMHEGHREMARIASECLDRKIEFELSVVNVDKPPLKHPDIRRRVGQFEDDQIVWVTRTATFVEKAKLFPEATFVVGADTMRRIVEPEYYRGGAEGMERGLDVIRRRKCGFLVFARRIDGQLVTLDELQLPDVMRERCQTVKADDFCMDISSTELRNPTDLGME